MKTEYKIGIIITVIVAVFLVVLFSVGDKDPNVTAADGVLSIDGMFGTQVPFSDIQSITLQEKSFAKIAPTWRKTGGYDGFTGHLKGNYETENLGAILIYVQKDSAPTILIERKDGKNIYISLNNSANTQALYETLTAQIAVAYTNS